jgi:hypothetical protein
MRTEKTAPNPKPLLHFRSPELPLILNADVMEIKWVEHNKKKVLLIDYTGLKMEKEMIQLLQQLPPYLAEGGAGTLLMLTDLTGCFATPGFMDAARKMEKEVFSKYQLKQAILGITGAKEILLKGFNLLSKNKLIPFNDKTEALNYLTSDKK